MTTYDQRPDWDEIEEWLSGMYDSITEVSEKSVGTETQLIYIRRLLEETVILLQGIKRNQEV